MIGKFEELVLLSVMKTGPKSVPSEIFATYECNIGGKAGSSFGAFYTTLERLARKGLLKMQNLEDRNGNMRKHYTITNSGHQEALEAVSASHALGGFALAGG